VSGSIVIAIYNSKGGVGKTSCCVNLAWTAAYEGKKVLLWDLDSQGASSYFMGRDLGLAKSTRKLLKGKASWKKEILSTDFPNLFIIPSDQDLKEFDLVAEKEKHSRKLLEQGLETIDRKFDIIFLDCPPGLTKVTENILKAGDLILVPLIPNPLSSRAFEQILDFIGSQKKYNKKVHTFVSMADLRKTMHKKAAEEILEDPRSLKTVIPQIAEIEKMGQDFKPSAMRLKSRSRGLFLSLWNEIEALFQ